MIFQKIKQQAFRTDRVHKQKIKGTKVMIWFTESENPGNFPRHFNCVHQTTTDSHTNEVVMSTSAHTADCVWLKDQGRTLVQHYEH